MPRALILGGTGLIGAAAARRLLAAGWQVDAAGRDPGRMPADLTAAGARFVAADHADPGQLRSALGDGADLLVDCACYTAADARALLPLAASCAGTAMLSAKAVYVDAQGRHINSTEPPRFEGPVPETQPTMAPGDGDYQTREGYGANKVAAERVLLDSGLPVTVIRPSRVHGPNAPRPCEWVFAKRALDRRPVVFLAGRGAGIGHNTAAANIAALIETVAAQPGTRVLNCADPDARSALEISRIVAAHFGHSFTEVLLDAGDPAAARGLGRHLWRDAYPVLLDMTAAHRLGYVPAGDYAATVAAELDWLAAAHGPAGPGGVTLPPGCEADYFDGLTDYAAEDAYLAAR